MNEKQTGRGPIRLTSAGLGAGDAFDYRREMSAGTYRLRQGGPRGARSEFDTTMRNIGDVVLSDYRSTPVLRSRNARLLRADARPYLKLRLYLSGIGGMLVSGDQVHVLAPGDLHLIDQSREFTEVGHGGRMLNLLLPHDAIGSSPARHGVGLRAAAGGGAGRMLTGALVALAARMEDTDEDGLARDVADLLALLRALIEGGADSLTDRAVVSARRKAAQRYIARALGETDLAPADIARALGVSRSTLYRDFAPEGGLERYIVRTRLDRGFDLLARAQPRRGRVDRVAEQVGFGSIHHFSNAFKARFGLRPSEVLGLMVAEDATPAPPQAFPPDRIEAGRRMFDIPRGTAA